MLGVIVRRLLLSVPLVLVVSAVTFVLVALAPGQFALHDPRSTPHVHNICPAFHQSTRAQQVSAGAVSALA